MILAMDRNRRSGKLRHSNGLSALHVLFSRQRRLMVPLARSSFRDAAIAVAIARSAGTLPEIVP